MTWQIVFGKTSAVSNYHSSPESMPRRGFWDLPLRQQIGYGCLAIFIIGLGTIYCAGIFSIIVRPAIQRPPTPTMLALPTQASTPTQAPPTILTLPRGSLVATPTQAPIPTRESPTLTPTVDLTNPAPSVTLPITGTRTTLTPTRRITMTATITLTMTITK